MRIMVTGAAGQLGSAIVARFGNEDLLALTRRELDVTDDDAVRAALTHHRPDAVVNCVAYNDVDGAEEHAQAALAANALAVRSLATWSAEVGATLVHYSTDFVFDGESDRPYVESDQVRPLGNYGLSKLLGELFAAEHPDAYTLRVESLYGGTPAKSSVDKIVAAIRAGQPARVFTDRTVSPSYVADVAEATAGILTARPATGIYHCVNDGATTWLALAEEIARIVDRPEAELVPVPSSEVRLRASRPRYCALSNHKLRDAGIAMPSWQDSLRRYLGRADD